MGIILRRPADTFVPVLMRGGAVWRLRQATTVEQQIAGEITARRLVEISASHQSAAALRELFGPILDLGNPIDPDRLNATSRFLVDVELALICSDGWEGIYADDGRQIEAPTAEWAALLLADPTEMERARRVLYAGLHEERAEKNALSASPDGAAVEAKKPAETAAG